jgi:hypothetical protein
MSEDIKSDSAEKQERPHRTPLGAKNRLTFKNLDPAYQYRVINDKDDRLIRAQEAGYEFVLSDEQLGDRGAMTPKKLGKKVSKPVGNDTTGFLMRIKKEWYEEDQAEKQRQLDESEKALKPNLAAGQYGKGLTSE